MTTDGVNSRELALEVLLAVEKEEEYCHVILSAVLEKYQYLTKQERSFLTRLCNGTIERTIELDYVINQFSRTKVNKMKPVIRCILRMGVYQLKYMDSVPASAACNEAVKLAERKGFRNLKGFVNGVLRNISRNLYHVEYPEEEKAPLYAASIRFSIPEWMLAQWSGAYGMEKAKSIAAAFQKEARMAVRTNRMKTSPEQLTEALAKRGISAERVYLEEYPDFNCALYLSGYDYLSAIPEFLEGQFMVQDVASMLAACLAAPKPGDYVIDVCGAPGSKSLYAAELLHGTGMVEARDVSDSKISLIDENIKRCDMQNIRTRKWDARVLDKASVEKADLVLADLPCSGLGVLRKKPDIRMTEEQEQSLVLLQREILSVVCRYVKPGGTLLYSTCTIDRMENEENTAWFLEQNPQFSLDFERQFFPDEGELDGFYIARFVHTKTEGDYERKTRYQINEYNRADRICNGIGRKALPGKTAVSVDASETVVIHR